MSVDYQLITTDHAGNIHNIDAGLITDGIVPDTSRPFRNIRIAFESLFKSTAENLSPQITNLIFENVTFKASQVTKSANSTEILRGTLLPAETQAATLGGSATDFQRGIFQIDYYTKVGLGGFTDRLDSITNVFKRNTVLESNGTTITIDNTSLGAGQREDAFFVRPLNVSYFAVTPARS